MPAVRERPSARVSRSKPALARRPAWDVALLFPDQGQWSEEEYLDLDSNRLVEFTEGHIEVLPLPTFLHQRILLWLRQQMNDFVEPRDLGEVLIAPLPVRVAPRIYREPDILFLATEHSDWEEDQCSGGADLVVEIVSPNNKKRDLVQKRVEYARAKIPEYWIVNPQDGTVCVLNLKTRVYEERRFVAGEIATSRVLAGFQVVVTDLFNSARKPRERRKKS
ncbi:MAG: Uma2 family endonuclease [Planctomycetaceae bacterium]